MRIATVLLVTIVGACAAPGSRTTGAATGSAPAAVSEAEAVVQAQVEAYNRGDLEAFLATYAEDVRIHQHPDRVLMSCRGEMAEEYGPLFQQVPDLHAAIANRIVQGEYVIDHEVVTGIPGDTIRAVAIYQVRGGLIRNVWFIR